MLPLRVQRRAQDEIVEAVDWYRARSPQAAADLLAALDDAMHALAAEPERYPVVHGRLRRVLLQRFPYAVYFKPYARTVVVVGVIHGHRHPATWLRRAAP